MTHLYKLSVLALLVAIYFLVFNNFTLQNQNSESMDMPLSIGYLQDPANPMWQNYKDQDPFAYGYPNKTFHPEWLLKCSPFLTACYYPFVKLFGINSFTCTLYGTFFSLLAVLLTFIVAHKMFDKWTALLSCFFLISSLSWLIHSKIGIQQPMPSVCLMIGVAYCLWSYNRIVWPTELALLGVLLSFCFMTGWIVFAFASIMTVLGIVIFRRNDVFTLLVSGFIVISTFLIFTIGFTALYSVFTGIDFIGIHKAVYDGFFYRFNQGSVPAANHLGLFERIVYCLKCVFVNSEGIDHPDKYLEGVPSVPMIFSLMFFIGLWYSRKESALMLWLVSGFGVFLFYLFAGRYGLLVLPAMAIIASHGILVLFKKVKYFTLPLLIGVMFIWIQTNQQYYQDFTLKRTPNFEIDRMRGHWEFSQWLQANTDPKDTLVILGDPVNMNAWQLMFHNFEKPYRFEYLSEKNQNRSNAVYVFGRNYFSILTAKPDFTYSYNGNELLRAYLPKK